MVVIIYKQGESPVFFQESDEFDIFYIDSDEKLYLGDTESDINYDGTSVTTRSVALNMS